MILLREKRKKKKRAKSVKQIIELAARRKSFFLMGKLRDCEIMKTMTQLLERKIN